MIATVQRKISLFAWIFLLVGCSEEKEQTASGSPESKGKTGGFFLSSKIESEKRESRSRAMNPASDGWLSESYHDRTNARLKELGELMVEGGAASDLIQENEESEGNSLEPTKTTVAYDQGGIQVNRTVDSWSHTLRGEPLVSAILKLGDQVQGGKVKFKQFDIEQVTEGMAELSTTAFVWLKYKTPQGKVLRNMTWQVDWDMTTEQPTIKGITVIDWEEIVFANANSTMFEDRTLDVIGGLEAFSRQIAFGANTWVSRLSGTSSRRLLGISVGDLDGDGWDDVFCPQPDGLPNLIFVRQPDGTIKEKAEDWGLDWLNDTSSTLIVDFDNDGNQDLAIALSGRLVLMRNKGGGEGFEPGPEFAQEDSSAMCAADVNNDGLLDLFIGNYEGAEKLGSVVKPDEIYNATGGGPNHFYLNQGGFRFKDATEEFGFDVGADRMALAASWEDFDGDGDQDLYVANDFGPNCFYLNEEGKFIEVAEKLGAEDPSTGMSVSWGDVNQDGRFDAIVGNMFSSAGNRVTSQQRFRNELRKDLDVDRVRYLARGNTFLVNQGDKFSEESSSSGIINTQWTWSMLLADINNDSREDILAANGFITGREVDDL